METPKELEIPKGLNDCTLTDINLLREWLRHACNPQKQESELFRRNIRILQEGGYDRSVAKTLAACKAFEQEEVKIPSLNVRVLNIEHDRDQRMAA